MLIRHAQHVLGKTDPVCAHPQELPERALHGFLVGDANQMDWHCESPPPPFEPPSTYPAWLPLSRPIHEGARGSGERFLFPLLRLQESLFLQPLRTPLRPHRARLIRGPQPEAVPAGGVDV